MKVSGIRSPLEFRVVHINGIALHVILAGPANGKPLVFLHGFPEFWFAWQLLPAQIEIASATIKGNEAGAEPAENLRKAR
jgi:pimeloyl-ACP methyl ester carboxylesterase